MPHVSRTLHNCTNAGGTEDIFKVHNNLVTNQSIYIGRILLDIREQMPGAKI